MSWAIRIARWAVCLGVGVAGAQAAAADLTIGIRNEPQTLDPHYLWGFSNSQAYYHYLGYMIRITPDGKLLPSLAASWKPLNDNEWVFRLNPEAKFSDGSPVTPADIVASYQRAIDMPGGGYRGLFALVERFEIVDAGTLKIHTRQPYPALPYTLTQVPVIPKAVAEKAQSKDFMVPSFNVSAGPYVLTKYEPGSTMVFKPNPYYWEKPKWDNLTFRFLSDSSARLAALMSGSIDMIDGVLPDDAEEIDKKPGLHSISGPSGRMVYIAMDQSREITPEVFDNDGKPLKTNPFKDLRVRKALALAVDRKTIVDRILKGRGGPLSQMGTPGQGGYDPDLPVVAYDPDQARQLLKEAGYPDGFRVTLSCPNGHLVNDSRVCQAVGQMLARVGIKASVNVMPWSVLVTKVTCHCDKRPSFFMTTWNNTYAGEVGAALSNLIRSYDKATGKGSWNQGEYASTPELDAMIDKAFATIDDDARHALQRRAMKMAMEDFPVLPLHYQAVTMGARKDLTPWPATIEYTLSEYVKQDGKAQ